MSRPRALLGFAIWLAVALFTVAMLVLQPAGHREGDQHVLPVLAYEIGSGGHMDFVLPAQVSRFKVLSRTRASPALSMPPARWIDYGFDITWLDEAGDLVRTQTYRERSRRSRFPSPARQGYRNAWISGDPQVLNDERVTVAPGTPVLPGGGLIRVSVPEDQGPMILRVFGERSDPELSPETVLLGSTSRQRRQMLRRAGVPSWSLLDLTEREALAAVSWRALQPRGRLGLDYQTRWLMQSSFRLGVAAQQVADLYLTPGRKLAVDLRGPVSLRLSGPAGVDQLGASLVADLPPDGPAPSLRATTDEPLGMEGEDTARRLHIDTDTVVSLVLSNDTSHTIGPFMLTMDEPDPTRLFGWTAATRLGDVLPAHRLQGGPDHDRPGETPLPRFDPDMVALAPEWRFLNGFRVGPGQPLSITYATPAPERGGIMQIEVRPVLDGPRDTTPRAVTVVVEDDQGERSWGAGADIPAEPAPFEYLIPTSGGSEPDPRPVHLPQGGQWIGEPVLLHVVYGQGMSRVRVESADDLFVVARVHGPALGDPDIYPLPWGQVRVRYRWRPVRTWHRLTPSNEGKLHAADQSARVAANVRLEPLFPPDEGDGGEQPDRSYVTVDPVGAGEGQVWLTPVSEQPGPIYCGYDAGETDARFVLDEEARRQLDGRLRGVLWTADASSLGRTWRVDLDGDAWRSGRLLQRLVHLSGVRTPSHRTVSLRAPEGSTLWLRTWGGPTGLCARARRSVRAWTLPPGGALHFKVRKDRPQQVFVLAGLASSETSLGVRIDTGVPMRLVGLYTDATRAERTLRMPLEPGVTGTLLDDPDRTLPLLQTRGIALGSDLDPGVHTITVENPGAVTVQLRAAWQSDQPAGQVPSSSSLVQAPGGGP